VRYFLIKYSRGKVIAFDLDEALSFEGESGPYIQYAVVRASNIFQKIQHHDGLDEAALLQALRDVSPAELTGENGDHELWSLVLEASRLDEVVEQVIRSLEFSVLAKYAFSLAQAFNAFYHRSPILKEEARRCAPVESRGGDIPAQPTDARARADGNLHSAKDVVVASDRQCPVREAARLQGVRPACRRRGADPRLRDRPAEVVRRSTASCCPAAVTCCRPPTARPPTKRSVRPKPAATSSSWS
jgi:hypothetical protein